MIEHIAVTESGSQFASAWLNAMADESGSNLSQGRDRYSPSPSPNIGNEGKPRLNLLLAEDNLPDVLLVREAIQLEHLPVEIYVAPDGAKAMEFIANAENDPSAPCPQVLILDLNLPKISGLEVLRRIRTSSRCKDIPVLVVTSSDAPGDRKGVAEFGARYFRKPASYDEFLKLGAVLKRFLQESGVL